MTPVSPTAATSAAGPPIEAVMRRITEVSTLPHIIQRVVQVGSNPNSGANDLRAILESDPALSSRVMRCVNSAAYGVRYKVSNLQRAISYLGFKEVRNLAVTASVAELFKHDQPQGSYTRGGLWRHLVWVGVASRMIAMRMKSADFEDAFLAGLLHDFGIILEDQYCHGSFSAMMRNLSPQTTLAASEQAALGIDHTILGARVAEKWSFPPHVVAAIRFHHMCQNYRGECGQTVAVVELANQLCTLRGVTSCAAMLPRSATAMTMLGLSKQDLVVMSEDLEAEVEERKELLLL